MCGENESKDLMKNMRQVVNEPQSFVRYECPLKQAYQINKLTQQILKNELLDKFAQQGETLVSYYLNVVPQAVVDNMRNAKEEYLTQYQSVTNFFRANKTIDQNQAAVFIDLCAWPHIENSKIDLDPTAMKVDKIAWAYRQADEKNQMMTRIYCIIFANKEELKSYEDLMEEAKKRDHRVLWKKLWLFAFSDLVGAWLPLFLPKGNIIKTELEKFIREEKEKRNYSFVCIPHMAKVDLYKKSGHLGKYDAMLPTMTDHNGDEFVMKPMNCPHHFEIYNAQQHSYRDLPYRVAENTSCYRNEKTGELHGLTRVKCLTQDDTHHFVRHDQIKEEIDMILKLMEYVYNTFDFNDFKVEISVRDPHNKQNYFGGDDLWTLSEQILIDATEKRWVPYTIEEGEAAFYGPKIDIRVKDSIGRNRQLTTVQLDFNQPENFNMTYIGEDGTAHRPAVLHVAILGSVERFMGVMIEHFAWAFPVRLAPVQARIIPVADVFNDYADKLLQQLKAQWIRAECDDSTDSFAKKIRNGEMMKIPYLLIVGQQEQDNHSVNVRSLRGKDQKEIKADEFIAKIVEEYRTRAL